MKLQEHSCYPGILAEFSLEGERERGLGHSPHSITSIGKER